MSKSPILKVAVPAPLHGSFDYLPPADRDVTGLQPGVRIWVPFGRSRKCGVLLGVERESRLAGRLKPAEAVIDREPLFSVRDLELLHWVSSYYHHPIGEVIHHALPVRLRRGEALLGTGREGWRLTDSGRALNVERFSRAPRQRELHDLLLQGPVDAAAWRASCTSGGELLRRFSREGWIEPCELESTPGSALSPDSPLAEASELTLNDEQRSAVEQVASSLGAFSVNLLEGVTGSGKTEVYLQLARRVLECGGQVLLMVPEIGLTPQLLERFASRIRQPMAVLHSALAEGERELAWNAVRKGEARLLIGTRSSLFCPLPDLQLVLVDEEHDLSLKQQDGLRYSARDMAVVLARQVGCPVLLGSATPSLESLANARAGRYQHLRLPRRAGAAKPPRMQLLDIRSARLNAGLSPPLVERIRAELVGGGQVLLFLNRRGFAPQLTCHDCGWVAQCRRCDARLTLHLAQQRLRCHHCGAEHRQQPKCPECQGEDLRPLGQGTERLEGVLEHLYPDVSVARIDRDSTRRKGSLERLLREIREGRHRLLLGTQMLAKGHHFPDVTLVAILDVDAGLFGSDFRSAERMAQQIIQVAGRAGRAERPGQVVIQTRHPEHPLLLTLLQEGYPAFAEQALAERREAELPPYSYQALVRAEAPAAEAARGYLQQVAERSGRIDPGVAAWGPVPAPMERRAGRYRAQLLLQSGERSQLQRLLEQLAPELGKLPGARKVRWSLDVDPQEFS